MSKQKRSIRLASVAGVALLQLFLLPAAQLLHVGCGHTHGPAGCETQSASEPHSHDGHTHCCHHHHGGSSHEEQKGDSDHQPQTPHDSHSCPICQVVLAARICDFEDVQVSYSNLISAWTIPHVSEVCSAPVWVLPSRGPPA